MPGNLYKPDVFLYGNVRVPLRLFADGGDENVDCGEVSCCLERYEYISMDPIQLSLSNSTLATSNGYYR